ncbi:iron-containing alcohol dehydrogenase [Saccharopolyspora spinosa]|uniref:iron-containing alcohol dehydrogenase n=1 Tax=Saccharopolyspora spinosa TaxID=60894 RepID=UPI00376EFB57
MSRRPANRSVDAYQCAHPSARIARVLGLPSRTPEQGFESYAVAIERLRDAVGIPPSFAEIGVEETSFLAALPTQAMNAYEDQCAPTNPRAPVLETCRS